MSKRMTSQRRLIMDFLQRTKSHPSAKEIYGEIREILPNISFGTVYRNLNLLESEGAIQELKFTDNGRFDDNPEPHYHFQCRMCGKVDDMDLPPFEDVLKNAQAVTDSVIESHQIQFGGICYQCKQGGKNGN